MQKTNAESNIEMIQRLTHKVVYRLRQEIMEQKKLTTYTSNNLGY